MSPLTVKVIAGGERPGGVGEEGPPTVAPAIANALLDGQLTLPPEYRNALNNHLPMALHAHFADAIARDDMDPVLRAGVPALIPGVAAAALHDDIRTAHAVGAGQPGELATALAYWAAAWSALPPDPLAALARFAATRCCHRGATRRPRRTHCGRTWPPTWPAVPAAGTPSPGRRHPIRRPCKPARSPATTTTS